MKNIQQDDETDELISYARIFVTHHCADYNIDWSHGLTHSEEVLQFAKRLMADYDLLSVEIQTISLSAFLHDMCDSKYCDEGVGIAAITSFLVSKQISCKVIQNILFIMSTMSYSKVTKHGYPNFGGDNKLELCYHIVRISDLLAGYNPERSIVYNHIKNMETFETSVQSMRKLFEVRVNMYISDGLFDEVPASKAIAAMLSDDAELFLMMTTEQMKSKLISKQIIKS